MLVSSSLPPLVFKRINCSPALAYWDNRSRLQWSDQTNVTKSKTSIPLGGADMVVDRSLKTATEDGSNVPTVCHAVISSPHENDVLMGRGGKNNQHSGNERLRELARLRCEDYSFASKTGKSDISKELVRRMRELEPPARFLRKDPESRNWEDVGDEIAREKTSQVLRDAVSEKKGLMVNAKATTDLRSSKEKFPPDLSKENKAQINHPRRANRSIDYSSNETLMKEMSLEDLHTFVPPYQGYAAINNDYSSAFSPRRYPSITRATESHSRKRPRINEELSSVSAKPYDHFSPPGIPHAIRTPQRTMLSTPNMMAQCSLPGTSYFAQPSSHLPISQHRSPASARITEPYAVQSLGRNEPWVADASSQFSNPCRSPVSARVPEPYLVQSLGRNESWVADPRLPIASANDFDPYNEDILSDHSDHRDGSVSPFTYPDRDSL